MKISVITATMNDGTALARTVDSVYAQRLPRGVELEHIIVDGGRTESAEVERAERLGSKVLRMAPRGVYNAINAGIAAATGDVIGLVHGTDFFADADVLGRIAGAFGANDSPDFTYGDVTFCAPDTPGRIVRYYSGAHFSPDMLLRGFAPPHPSLFVRRDVMRKIGPYREDLVIASDFDLFVRLFHSDPRLRGQYIAGPAVTMSTGGISSGLLTRIGQSTSEICRVLRDHGLPHSRLRILSRFLVKRKTTKSDD